MPGAMPKAAVPDQHIAAPRQKRSVLHAASPHVLHAGRVYEVLGEVRSELVRAASYASFVRYLMTLGRRMIGQRCDPGTYSNGPESG